MKNVVLLLILQGIILVCVVGFLYQKNPTGLARVSGDLQQLIASAISGSNAPAATPEVTPPPSTASAAPAPLTPVVTPALAPASAPSTAPAPAPAPMASAAPAWTPPAVMPAQPNWTWRTISGETFTNVKVLSVDRDSVMIMYDGGGQRVPLAYLPTDLQKLFNYTPPAVIGAPAVAGAPVMAGASALSAPLAGPPSVVANMVSGNLVHYTVNGLQALPDTTLAPARFIAVYYSAQWCPPCHAFTPKLVQFYNSFKPTHPDFDLIFVSEDHDENQMHDYMQEMAMPWPAVRYDQLMHPTGTFKGSGIEGYANSGIPDLVLLDSTGRVLSDSFHGSEYVGPEAVMADIQTMVKN